jgi:hypothetical protein
MAKEAEIEAKKAESWQGLMAFLIPLTLFLACIGAAAGSFLIYHHESLGWIFLVIAGVIIILNFIALIHFQNKLRAKGVFAGEEAADIKQTPEHR